MNTPDSTPGLPGAAEQKAKPITSAATSIREVLSRKGGLLFSYDRDRVEEAAASLSLVPDQRRALFFAEKSRADFVFNTAALEGNPFTFPEVKTLLDGITVGGHKLSDADQVLNLNRGLSYLIGLVKAGTFRIDAETACAINGIVARDEALEWGQFRSGQVSIGGTDYMPPKAGDLPAIFDSGKTELNREPDPIRRAFLAFLWGSLNQFFYDGNKRTARFLASGTLLVEGYPPFVVLAKDQLAYNQVMTRFYDSQDATEALQWLFGYYAERVRGFGFDKEA